jgi:hypothetical protein
MSAENQKPTDGGGRLLIEDVDHRARMTDNVTTFSPPLPSRKPDDSLHREERKRELQRNRTRKKRLKDKALAVAARAGMPGAVTTVMPPVTPVTNMGATPVTRPKRDGGVTVAAFAAAVALAFVEVFFGVVGMTAIFPANPVPVMMVMTGILEAAKLVTVAWLAKHWRASPLVLRAPLIGIVFVLMLLTGIGTSGYFTRAHLAHQIEAHEAIDSAASPVAEKIKIAETDLHDLDDRIQQFDGMVRDATARGRTRTAMALVDDQAKKRSDLVTERRTVAARLADLRVQISAVESRRAKVAAEIGPARYLADLLGWGDGEAAVKLITLLLVLVIDPAAILLMLAATCAPPPPAGDR